MRPRVVLVVVVVTRPQVGHAPSLARVVVAAQSAELHVHCRGPDQLVPGCLVLPPWPGACSAAARQSPLQSSLLPLLHEEMPGQARLLLVGRHSHLAE